MLSYWPFADPEWWGYSISSSVPKSFEYPDSALPMDSKGRLDLNLVGDHEMEIVRGFLNTPRPLSKSQARAALFCAKALKKWKFMPPALKGKLSVDALDGFCARNDLANRESCLYERPYLVQHMRDYLQAALPKVDLAEGRFGPGSVAERLTHPRRFAAMGVWHLDATDPTYRLRSDYLSKAERAALALDDHRVARLCAVDKSYTKRRLITVEPTWRTFEQQAVRQTLLNSIHCGSLARTAMDQDYVDGARIQRRLALHASKNKRLATLDLKDASDNIAFSDVVAVFPGWVVAELERVRSSGFCRPENQSEVHPMHIYAGMGNATTFVVETLFFSAYVYAVARLTNLSRFVSVFGDDIICSSYLAEELITNWQMPCFRVNALKSFWGLDPVRESCGIYAREGVDITVPHIDGYYPSTEGRYGVCELHKRLAGDDLFWGLAHLIASEGILENYSFLIDGYPSISDWTVPTYDDEIRHRHNSFLQIREVQVPAPEARSQRLSAAPQDLVSLGLRVASMAGLIKASRCRDGGYAFPLPGFKYRKRWRSVYHD